MCLTHCIQINGVEKVVPGGRLTYEELVRYAGLKGYPSATYYWRGKGDLSRSGTLYSGKEVALAEGMIFTVVHTGNA